MLPLAFFHIRELRASARIEPASNQDSETGSAYLTCYVCGLSRTNSPMLSASAAAALSVGGFAVLRFVVAFVVLLRFKSSLTDASS